MSGRTLSRILAVLTVTLLGMMSSGIAIAGDGAQINRINRPGITPDNPVSHDFDTLDFTAHTSTGDATVDPTKKNPNHPTGWVYALCLASGTFDVDFPITFSIGDGGITGDSYSVSFTTPGGAISGLTKTPPSGFSILDTASPADKTIHLHGVAVADGTYQIQVHIAASGVPGSHISLAHDHVQIVLIVGAQCATPSSCFFTDGSFNYLLDCDGQPVTDSSGGTFQIVGSAHHGTIVSAVNPGEIFYDFIWTNTTGQDQDLWICLNEKGLNPMGAQSVHAATFTTSGFTQDLTNFDLVGADGLPCGPWGPCEITVHLDETLWVEWHLRPSLVGGSTYGISSDCPGNGTVSATVTLWTGPCEGDILDTCTADASGYLKATP